MAVLRRLMFPSFVLVLGLSLTPAAWAQPYTRPLTNLSSHAVVCTIPGFICTMTPTTCPAGASCTVTAYGFFTLSTQDSATVRWDFVNSDGSTASDTAASSTSRDIYGISSMDVNNLVAGDSVSLSVSSTSMLEKGGTISVIATRSALSGSATNVTLDINGGSAILDDDFTQSGSASWDGPLQRNVYTFQIPANSWTGTLTLASKDDVSVEADESIRFSIYKVDSATWSAAAQTVWIDDDDRQVSLGVSSNSIAENGGSAVLTAYLSPTNSLEDTAVTLGFTGAASAQYTVPSTIITIPKGQSSASMTINAVNDAIDEPDEDIVIDVTGVTNASEAGTQRQTVKIVDDDVPQVSLSLSGSPLAENNTGVATVTATLSQAAWQDVTVDLALGGTATSGTDYAASATSITIPAGSLTRTMTLTGIADTLDEANETVIVSISNVTNAVAGAVQQVTATITDDDPPPTVALSATGSPFAENGGTASVVATLSTPSSFDVVVDLAFTGTATNAVDYTRSAESITIPAGSLSGTVTLTAVDDAVDEPDETVVANVTSVTNGTESGTQSATATIADDDDPPAVTLSLSNSPFSEAGGSATVTATLSAVSSFDVTVGLAFSGTATSGADYTPSASSITVPAGNLAGSINLSAIDDTLDEPDETVIVDISTATNATENGVQQVTGQITDDDLATVTLALSGSPFAENGGSATVGATMSIASTSDVTVHLGFSGTAVAADYTAAASSIIIPAGSTSGSVTLTATDDAVYEGDETVVVDVTSVDGAVEETTSGEQRVTATITDDDPQPMVTLSTSVSSFAENGGTVDVKASLSAPAAVPVTVDLALSGTATPGSDYVTAPAPLSLVIAAGSTEATLTLTGIDDAIDEADETVVADISGVTNGIESGTQQVTATIVDDDAAPAVSLSLAGSPMAENGGSATVKAQLSAPSGLPVTVDLGLSGTAVAGADYTSTPGTPVTLVIPAGSTEATLTLASIDDAVDEADETIVVDLTGAVNAAPSGVQQVTATIADDDLPPVVSLALAGSPIAENGGSGTVKAQLSAPSGLAVTVNLGLSGSAVSGTDYSTTPAAPIALVIPPGSTEASLALTAIDDALDEAGETIVIDITGAANAVPGAPQQVIATIADDDPAPSVSLSLAGSPMAENGGVAAVKAQLSAPSGLPVTVSLALSGTATAAADYATNPGLPVVLTIPAGSTEAVLTLTGVDDALDEPDETIVAKLTGATNAVPAGTQQVVATLTDDDTAPSVSLSLAGSPLAENGGMAVVTATLSAVSALPATVDLTFAGTAANIADYTRSAATITIAPGTLSGSVALSGVDDALDEADETVVVNVSALTNATAGTTQQVIATIADDDTAPVVTLAVAGTPVAENGGTATVSAQLSTPSGLPVTVELALSGTASQLVDFTAAPVAPVTLVIPPGATEASLTLTAVDDAIDEADETMVVGISAATNATIGAASDVMATIADDDPPPTISLTLAGSPVAENGGTATVTAQLSGPSGLPVTVDIGLSGTATIGSDYTAAPATPVVLVIPAGATAATLTLTSVDDALDESDETIVVDISGVTNAIAAGAQQVTATIVDDDAQPTVSLSLANSPLLESGGAATVTATLSGPSSYPVTVDFGFSGTAANGIDYTPSAESVTIPSGSTGASIALTALPDTVDESDETIVVSIAGVTNAVASTSQQVTATILDDDAPPAVSLSIAGTPLAENGGTATATATLSGLSVFPVVVNLGFSGTATNGVDYTRSAESLTIPPGSLTAAVTLAAIQDEIDEVDETIVIDVAAVTNAVASGGPVTAMIADDDTATVSLAAGGSTIAEAGGTATLTATLSQAVSQTVRIDLGFSGTAGSSDYTATAAWITIPAGSMAGSMSVTAVDDSDAEPDETIVVDIAGVANAAEDGVQRTTVTITDDDPARLAFTMQPSNAIATKQMAPAVAVSVLDSSDRPVRTTLPVTLVLGANPSAGTLSGGLTVETIDGVATFGDLSIDKRGAGYTLIATAPPLAAEVSNQFQISPNVIKTFAGMTPTGTGLATISMTGGGADCTFSEVSLTSSTAGEPAPRGLVFPHGVFRFTLSDCTPGQPVTFTMTFPAPLAEGTHYWRYGPRGAGGDPQWEQLPATIQGDRMTLTMTDGDEGDDDCAVNGVLIDTGGAAFAPTDIPTFSQWALILMAVALGAAGVLRLRA